MEQLNIRSNKRAKLNMDQSTTVNYSNMNNNENEFDMKTAKSNKSYTKLIPGTKDKIEEEGYNTEKIAKDYQRDLERNKGIPRYFRNLLNLSPTMKKKYDALKFQLKIIDCILCLSSFVSILCSIIDSDIVAINYNIFEGRFVISDYNNILRCVIIIMNLISVILIIKRYKILLDEHVLKVGSISNSDNLFTSNLFTKMVIELIFNSIFLPPLVDTHFEMKGTTFVSYDYNLKFNTTSINNDTDNITDIAKVFMQPEEKSIRMFYNVSPIITFIILMKLYHFFRVIHTFSYWNSLQAQNVCKNMLCEANLSFGLRAYLKMKPFISLVFCVVVVIVFFGIGEKLFEFYNSELTDLLNESGIHEALIKSMHKFENMYNSFWLVLVTMSTIGYGDMVPTTYFGRILALFACICGTFVMSLLVVFLNAAISFDEVEKHVFNSIVDEKFSRKKIQKEAIKVIFKAIEYNFLRKRYPAQTSLYRFKILYLDLKYLTRNFKLKRIVARKNEIDLDEILGSIKFNLEYCVTPFKNSIDDYNRERLIFDHSMNYLKDSSQMVDKYLSNSMQIVNLLKIMNKQKYLDDLKSIDDVYDSQVNILEEVQYYHKMKDKFDKIAGRNENIDDNNDKSSEDEKSEKEEDESEKSDESSEGSCKSEKSQKSNKT